MRLQRLNRRKILVEEEEEEGSTGCDVVPRAQTVQSRAGLISKTNVTATFLCKL